MANLPWSLAVSRAYPRPAAPIRRRRRSGLALEVGDLVGLGVGLLLRAVELVLGLALALFLPSLALQRTVVGDVAGGLLGSTCELVEKAHAETTPLVDWVPRDDALRGCAETPF